MVPAMTSDSRTSILPPPSSLTAPSLTADQLHARVLHRDTECFVIDKPAGLAVHKAGRITDHLELYLPHLAEPDGDDRIGEPPKLAHRLDRDTAGCLILGRTPWALKRFGQMFAAGHVEKTYWAVAEGIPDADSGVIDLPLLKKIEPKSSLGASRSSWTILPDPAGQPAVTEYRVLGTSEDDVEARVEVVAASLAKGLEFDHVLLLEPAAIVEAEHDRLTGLRRLYVCLTRAVTSLVVLHAEPLPSELTAN